MSCLVRVKYIQDDMIKNGGSIICSPSVILMRKEFDKIKDDVVRSNSLDVDETENIHKYMTKTMKFSERFIDKLLKTTRDEILNEILSLGNPSDRQGNTLAHSIVLHGHLFTFEEIICLKNVSNKFNTTLAHLTAKLGYVFTSEQIMKLNNPQGDYGRTIAHNMVIYNNHRFTVDDLVKMNNMPDKYGLTIAHYMARYGHIFTVDEILKLENPSANNKETIADNMEFNGYQFTKEDKIKLLRD